MYLKQTVVLGSRVFNVAAVLYLQSVLHVMLFTVCATCNVISTVKEVLYFYVITSRSLCAVRNMAGFCNS